MDPKIQKIIEFRIFEILPPRIGGTQDLIFFRTTLNQGKGGAGVSTHIAHHHIIIISSSCSSSYHHHHHLISMLITISSSLSCSSSPHHHHRDPLSAPAGTGRPRLKSNCELLSRNNFNVRYWSWNYRGCWHQTCIPIDIRKGI